MAIPSQDMGRNTLPSGHFAAATFADTAGTANVNNFAVPTRALYVGSSGNVKVVGLDDSEVTFSNVSAGAILPICVKRVFSTGTTATAGTVIALW